MSQNIYDDPDFHGAYRRLPRSEQGLAGAPEWPEVAGLLPELTGLDVVDLGCGFGAFAREAAERGASVDALDLSERMLARAAELTPDGAAITYRQADLDELELGAAAYDLAYSALTLHYVVDLPRLLVPGVRKQHRTFGTWINSLLDAGFTARRVIDWRPSSRQIAAQPELAEEVDRPTFLIVAAER